MPQTKAQKQPKDDARRHNRIAVTKQAPLTATSGGKIYKCFIEDISLSGLKLRFEDEVPEGKVIAIDHPVAGTLCGHCAWRKDSYIGMELQIPSSDLERVLRCICLVL